MLHNPLPHPSATNGLYVIYRITEHKKNNNYEAMMGYMCKQIAML